MSQSVLVISPLSERNNLEITYEIDSVFCKPMEGFEKEQQSEECDKLWTEVISEHCEGEARLCDCVP